MTQQSWAGQTFDVEVGPVAHGGHCVARHEGRVVFVRHAIPGEQVRVTVTEDRGGSFCRADAVEVLVASPDRVEAPCGYARPGGCGGCDFQHVSLAAQRRLKADVIAEQFQRLAGLTVTPEVEALDETGLGWRRRIRYAISGDGSPGLHAHRSDRVIRVEACPLGADGVGNADALGQLWPGADELEIAVDDDGEQAVLAFRRMRARAAGRDHDRGRSARTAKPRWESHQVSGPARLHYETAGHRYELGAGGFWQTHPRAAEVYVAGVLAHVEDGDRVLDLYAGAGLFTVALAHAVGPSGRVIGIEGDARAVADAEANLEGFPNASVTTAAVGTAAVLAAVEELGHVDVIVLDPPRSGAGTELMTTMTDLGPRTILYVACDPAALARDVGIAKAAGWSLAGLRAFDAFPMTHHMECLAVLHRA